MVGLTTIAILICIFSGACLLALQEYGNNLDIRVLKYGEPECNTYDDLPMFFFRCFCGGLVLGFVSILFNV